MNKKPVLLAILDGYLCACLRLAFNLDVEVAAECLDVAQSHLVPFRGQLDCEVEAVEACGLDTEETFGDDTAVETALGREVTL